MNSRRILLIWVLTASVLIGQAVLPNRRKVFQASGGGGATYLLEENFEAAPGYDLASWTEGGTPDEDNTATPSPLQGSQSLRCSSVNSNTRHDFTGQTDVWAYCLWNPDLEVSGASQAFIAIRTSGGTVLAAARMDSSRNVRLFANGSDSSASSTVITRDATYRVWLRFVDGGTCELSMCPVATTTRPTSDGSGNVYLTKAGASGTAAQIILLNNADGNYVFDRVLVDEVEIGGNP